MFVVALFSLDRPELVARDRGRPARPAAHRRGERCRGEAPRARGREHARRDRLRLAGRVAGRVHPRGGAVDRARRRLLPHASALAAFCGDVGAEPAESHRDAAEQDVVVTVTTSRDPVLRGEWLRPGALVCAVGANDRRARELDNVVLERAAFVCCDSLEQARLESGDLIEPVERRRARLARGARAPGGRRRGGAGPRSRTTTSSSSSRTGSPRGTSRSGPRRRSRARARRRQRSSCVGRCRGGRPRSCRRRARG